MFNPGAVYAVLMVVLPLADFAARFVPSVSPTARLTFGASSWVLAMFIRADPRAPTVASITQPTPYSILSVTPSSSQGQIGDAYNDLIQTLQKQNKKGLWSGKDDQALLANQKAEFHDAYATITDPLERCYWHRDTGVRDWYGVPTLCWDEIVRDKLQMLRDAIAQEDFSKLTWWPRSSKYSPFPKEQPQRESEQATEISTKQEVPVTKTKTPERETSEANSVTEAAAKITLESTCIKANVKVSRVSGIFDAFSRKISAIATTVTYKVSMIARSTIGAVSCPVTVLIPRFRSWLRTAIPAIHTKVSATVQSILVSFSIVVSYSQTALAQAKSWLASLWTYICLVTITAWSYLTTPFKLVRKYLMPLAPSPSPNTIPIAGSPQPTIRPDSGFNADIVKSLDGEKQTVLTKLTSLLSNSDGTATVPLPSTTNPLRYQSQFSASGSSLVTEPVQITEPATLQFKVRTVSSSSLSSKLNNAFKRKSD